MDTVRLVVGLGNPGREYARTRHNAGFMLVDRLAARWRSVWRAEPSREVRLAEARRWDVRVWLAQPLTFMNSSGEAVAAVLRYYRIELSQMLVALDDADLPLGEIRLRPGGGTGGHHGLESIEQQLGTTEYARLRLGIGRRSEDDRQIVGYVLGRFETEEAGVFEPALERAADAVECWLQNGLAAAMNRFNRAAPAPQQRKVE
jgi:PTH1 family peptidyl-tRNA hydrolase